jgi:hypothetical protein
MAELIDFVLKLGRGTLEKILVGLRDDLLILSGSAYALYQTELMIMAIEAILSWDETV